MGWTGAFHDELGRHTLSPMWRLEFRGATNTGTTAAAILSTYIVENAPEVPGSIGAVKVGSFEVPTTRSGGDSVNRSHAAPTLENNSTSQLRRCSSNVRRRPRPLMMMQHPQRQLRRRAAHFHQRRINRIHRRARHQRSGIWQACEHRCGALAQGREDGRAFACRVDPRTCESRDGCTYKIDTTGLTRGQTYVQ